MKVSKKLFIYIGFAAWIFLAGFMGYVILQQMKDKTAAENDIALNQGLIATTDSTELEAEKVELEADLATLVEQTEVLKTKLTHEIDNVDASDVVFEIAESNNVRVLSLSAPGASPSNLDTVPCDVYVIQTNVEGTADNLADFITDLNLAFDTGVIQNVRIDIGEAENVTPTANFLLELYNYRSE